MNNIIRIRPYVEDRVAILLERLREIKGLSIGKVLTMLLNDSETFQNLLEHYEDDDEIIEKIFIGLPID